MISSENDDPRKLRTLLARVSQLADAHGVPSVMVGLAAVEGDPHFPDFIAYLKSALRVEDGIFRMSRERAVLHIADTDRPQAEEVLKRLQGEFWAEYASPNPSAFEIRLVGFKPGGATLSVKELLKAVFAGGPSTAIH